MLTEKECNEELNKMQWQCDYLSKTFHTFSACKISESCRIFEKLICEHFSNPPLYMDEIPKGIWIWDNVNKECIRSLGCVELDGIIYVKFERSENSFITNYLEYDPNRFYRKEVRNVK